MVNPAAMRRAEVVAAILGCVLVLAALAIIWAARLSVPHDVYVSELGADGMPTAGAFETALVLIVIGGSLVAWAGRRVTSSLRILSAWTPAVSLWLASAFFLFASQVRCTAGCPNPYGDTFTVQTFAHTLAAVLGFGFAGWAMLQCSFARHNRILRIFSGTTGILVAGIAATGGIFSLLRFQVGLGSRLEFLATTLAIAWLVVFGGVLAAEGLRSLRASAPHEAEQAVR